VKKEAAIFCFIFGWKTYSSS